jgi:hypothetical protein
MCCYSYCDGSCGVPDDSTPLQRCQRDVDGRECRFVLNDDGTCPACETEACEICGEICEPHGRRAMRDVDEGKVSLVCADCADDDTLEDPTVEVEVALIIEIREPFGPGGLQIHRWKCEGRILGAKFQDTARPLARAIVAGSTKVPGGWQVTYFDESGEPTGDLQAKTIGEALRELTPARWELVSVTRPATTKGAA